jgi:hypothetical protein
VIGTWTAVTHGADLSISRGAGREGKSRSGRDPSGIQEAAGARSCPSGRARACSRRGPVRGKVELLLQIGDEWARPRGAVA